MTTHVKLNLLKELRKSDKMWGLLSILLVFHKEFYKFYNRRAWMLDFMYHMHEINKKNSNVMLDGITLRYLSRPGITMPP